MKTTRLQLSLLALFLGCASLQAQYKWADPLKQDFHTVRGQAWQDELKDSYARLPQRAEDKVRKPLWDLSRQSAGLSVVFRSNASEIKVRYVVKGGLSMPHMPATGVSGIDLYAGVPEIIPWETPLSTISGDFHTQLNPATDLNTNYSCRYTTVYHGWR